MDSPIIRDIPRPSFPRGDLIMASVFEALEIEDPLKDMQIQQDILLIFRKEMTEQGYGKSDVVINVLALLDLPDTKENRRIAATFLILGESLNDMRASFQQFIEKLGR